MHERKLVVHMLLMTNFLINWKRKKGKYEKLIKRLDKDQTDVAQVRKDYEDLRSMLEEDKKTHPERGKDGS